ncbi:MAG: hypothetical protein N4A45_09710, partial [Flavobacteriales bacterium]|nr:hypothetical protein [Flavobacteriales bacterium]
NAVGTPQLKDVSVSASKIQEDAVTRDHINPNVAGAGLTQDANGALIVNPDAISGAGNLTSTDITVTGGDTALLHDVSLALANNSVNSDEIADNAVKTSEINNGAVTADKIANNAVTTTKIINNAVTTDKINNGAITTTKIADNAVTTAKIANNAVTTDKIATGTANSFLTTDGSGNPQWSLTSSIDNSNDAFVNNSANNRVELGTQADGTTARAAGTEFVIQNNGRVGIGETTPQALLQIGNDFPSNGTSLKVNGSNVEGVLASYNGGIEVFKGNANNASIFFGENSSFSGYSEIRFKHEADDKHYLQLGTFNTNFFESSTIRIGSRKPGAGNTSNIEFKTIEQNGAISKMVMDGTVFYPNNSMFLGRPANHWTSTYTDDIFITPIDSSAAANKVLVSLSAIGNATWSKLDSAYIDDLSISHQNLAPGTADGQTLKWNAIDSAWELSTPFSQTLAEVYNTTGTQILDEGTFTDITFGTDGIVDGDYTTAATSITVSNAGRYEITYRVSTTSEDNARTGAEFYLDINGTESPGSRSYTYSRNNLVGNNSATVTKIVQLAASAVIRIKGQVYASNQNGTSAQIKMAANGSSLIVKRIK